MTSDQRDAWFALGFDAADAAQSKNMNEEVKARDDAVDSIVALAKLDEAFKAKLRVRLVL